MTSTIDTETTVDAEQFAQEWEDWHRELDAQRSEPHAFLAYTGFNLLGEDPQRFDGLPGAWSTGPEGAVVELAEGESLETEDGVVTGRHVFGPLVERVFRIAGSFGDAKAELSRRGGRDIVRALHPDHPTRLNFRGTPTYAPDLAWVISGTYEPFDEVQDREIKAYIPAITHRHDSPGRVRFEYDGTEYALTLIDAGPGAGIALFRDATSGVTTYEASRSLVVALPAEGSEVTLDFNRARNLQCAYIEFAPCPLAPAENNLPFAVEAGEKTPYEKQSAS